MTLYYSKSKKDYVDINDMHHQHVWYAFKKLCDQLEELGICEHIWEEDYKPTNLKKNGYVRKDVYKLLFDKCQQLEKRISELLSEVDRLLKHNQKIATDSEKLYVWNEYYQRQLSRSEKELKELQNSPKHRWKQSCVYTLSDIPNDYEGQNLVKQLKKYLNKDRYAIRARGQYLDDKTKKEEGWQRYTYGQPLSKSKCIRVYIDEKKESA
tara:strand:- start:676 stop:1305 length:630 start_codon:yes stop_codon:yes gene_type:complete